MQGWCGGEEDMASVDGGADAAVTTRIHSGWFEFVSLTSFLPEDVSIFAARKGMRHA